MLMKKLAGKKQYFDSGDYNMQNAKPKGPHKGPMVPNPMANPMTKPSESLICNLTVTYQTVTKLPF